MAKAKAETKEKPAKEEKEAAPSFKYGVPYIAEVLEIAPASVRVKLRNNSVPKAGKSYGWNTKADVQEVIDQIKAKAKASKDDEDEEEVDEEEPDEEEEEEEEAPKAKRRGKAK